MLSLEAGLKKKKLIKPRVASIKRTPKRRKAFIRVKKNKAYRLFGSRAFNLWRGQFRFTVKLKLLQIKFQLIGKLLLRNFKMNKHFFKKKSTLSYVAKLKSRSYLVKCRRNLRFFYIIERRILVVLARLYITRIARQGQLLFLIRGGYVSVDNAVIKNPYHLVQHKCIIRVIKTVPRALARVPKSLIINNLRWLFYRRSRRARRYKHWKLYFRRRG
jgi:ribosomal protein S4